MEKYHKELNDKLKIEYSIAQKARIQGLDPRDEVEIPIAKNMAERVEGLISVVAPQVRGSGMVERIHEFEIKFGKLDWRVALNIAEEVAREKFCKFKDKREAMEVGIRVGIAYVTNGVVASPLEGFTQLKIRKRRDGKEYFALYFSGPIRSAGGTGASVSVIIGDYIRKKMGYAEFDPDEREIKRFTTELTDYHEKVTNLQYFPSAEELEFMVSNLAVQIDGDPSEKYDVSNYKDLERVETNKIRNGPCLVLGEGLCQKAPKLLKQLDKWGKDMDLGHWKFLEEFLKIQKKLKAREEVKKVDDGARIKPDYTFIKDLVAGRPVLTHPLRTGGFRLRYGRARNTGLSSNAIHPATMFVLNNYIAVGTQIKMERPGKASALSLCDTIEGPIIKLKNQSVMLLNDAEEAKKYADDVEEILFLGDILISYGDFFNRAHMLVPCGYNEEWWAREIEKAIEKKFNGNIEKASEFVDVKIQRILLDPFNVSFSNALKISEKLDVPFVPRLTYHWKDINKDQFNSFVSWVRQGTINEDKIVLPFVYDINSDLMDTDPKRVLELLGVPHKFVGKEHVVVEGDYAKALVLSLNSLDFKEDKVLENGLDTVNKICHITQRDKSGTFIGARMGRPEKAKLRKMTGKPHCLFPVGEEGGRMRSFQSAIGVGKVTAEFPLYVCNNCNTDSIYPICAKCNVKTEKQSYCYICKKETEKCGHVDTVKKYKRREILIKDYFKQAQDKLGINELPELIKGIRGLSSEEHIPENLIKGILRAANDVYVNKDGTIRYDATELVITHFKPVEIGTKIEKLKELGYGYDIYGNPLEKDTQIIEIKPQDVIIPACKESLDEGGDDILLRSCKFIDGMLKYMYNLEPFYNVDEREDLVGHLIMAIAPHISAGIICRIIGFSNTQGFYAHPMLHCAVRRDADGDEVAFMLLLDALINFSRVYLPAHRGATQDAPLVLSSTLIPSEIDDMVFDVDITAKYPLELYKSALEYKMPWEIKVEQMRDRLGKENEQTGWMFTHDVSNINSGVVCSAYKSIPDMQQKVFGQLDIAEKIRAVDEMDVARLVIDRHFIRDIKGNLRKFSTQEFRCVSCNEKYRRPPLLGHCVKCRGRLLFTVSEGSVVKYLEPSISLAQKYELPNYLKQSLELTKMRIESVFGKDKERQIGLGSWY
ncbi:DNA polymerase II large subunit [Candidatus Woesearchaeota archaeon]|nr:DNA polymerase II large subunit [Candidatus Woesearchaeota archaeon]